MVRDVNKEKRVLFCQRLINRNDSLDDMIFSDESTVFLHHHKPAAYHPEGTANIVIPKPKHPPKLHVWGGISRRGTTELVVFGGIMEKTFFTNEILGATVLPFVREHFPNGHRFQQDNDPKHRTISLSNRSYS
jgi:hypothetical protein